MSDDKPKDDEKIEPILNLDQLHEKVTRELDEELIAEDKPKDDEPVKDEPAKNEPVVKDPVEGESGPKEPETPEPTPPPKEEPVVIQPEVQEIPTVKVRDAEGNIHEFYTVDDIPDDFEPETYKSFAVATSRLAQREIDVREAEKKVAADKETTERNARIDRIKEGWTADIENLKKSGDIGKDDQKTIDGVYTLIAEEMTAGRPVDSWGHAFEMYSYRQSKAEKVESQKKFNDEKSRRGGMVVSGNSANPAPRTSSNKVMESPPSGISLDQLHQKVLGSL
jgi:hypothetical protein